MISPTTAWICLLINQAVTPGLGTIVAGRLRAGLVELSIAFVGFSFVMSWFYELFKLIARTEDLEVGLRPYSWLAVIGLVLFGVSWILALVSSIGLVRRAVRLETRLPPRLSH